MCTIANADELYLDNCLSCLVLVDVTFTITKLVVMKYDVLTLSFSMQHFQIWITPHHSLVFTTVMEVCSGHSPYSQYI